MTINLNGATRLYPLLGDPIKYARSPDWLSKHFAKRDMNYISLPLEVRSEDLKVVLDGLHATYNVDGLSLTMPHKTNGTQYCSTLTETSKMLGVVSAIRRNKDGSWHGHMTDGDAFVKAQIDNGATIEGAKVLVLGAGATASSIVITMLEKGASDVAVYNRTREKAENLVELLGDKFGDRVRVADSNDPTGFDVISNGSSIGMDYDDPIPLDGSKLDASMFVGDVISGHGVTKIIKAAQDAGCKTADGDAMVIAVLDVMCDFLQDAWKKTG